MNTTDNGHRHERREAVLRSIESKTVGLPESPPPAPMAIETLAAAETATGEGLFPIEQQHLDPPITEPEPAPAPEPPEGHGRVTSSDPSPPPVTSDASEVSRTFSERYERRKALLRAYALATTEEAIMHAREMLLTDGLLDPAPPPPPPPTPTLTESIASLATTMAASLSVTKPISPTAHVTPLGTFRTAMRHPETQQIDYLVDFDSETGEPVKARQVLRDNHGRIEMLVPCDPQVPLRRRSQVPPAEPVRDAVQPAEP